MRILSVENVEKTYEGGGRGVAALKGVSFQIEKGGFVALTGPSGCGKSTLLHLISGLDRPSRGHVIFDGKRLDSLTEEERARLRRREIGFVFQFFNLLPTLTVAENVELPLALEGAVDGGEIARSLLDRVGLADRAGHFPAELSGGEMQRAAVARALVAGPKMVLADEPTGNLDSRNGRRVLELLADLNRELGVTVVLATHSREAAAFAGRELRLRDGLLVDGDDSIISEADEGEA